MASLLHSQNLLAKEQQLVDVYGHLAPGYPLTP